MRQSLLGKEAELLVSWKKILRLFSFRTRVSKPKLWPLVQSKPTQALPSTIRSSRITWSANCSSESEPVSGVTGSVSVGVTVPWTSLPRPSMPAMAVGTSPTSSIASTVIVANTLDFMSPPLFSIAQPP